MNALKVIVFTAFVAACQAAPGNYGVAPVGAAVVGVSHQAHVVDPPRTAVVESYHAGPAVATTHVQHGVVGSRTVQVGSQPVQVGHEYVVAGQSVHPQPAFAYSNNDARTSQSTRPLPRPAIPHAGPAPLAIPRAPVNLGPAPADTVTQTRILAPARAHTVITPRRTVVQPELHVNRVPVDVPVQVPVPVHRDVVVQKNVQRPYPVDAPHPVAVPHPVKVHPVHEVVNTPVIDQHSVSYHGVAGYGVAGHGVAGYGVANAGYGVANAGYGVAGHH